MAVWVDRTIGGGGGIGGDVAIMVVIFDFLKNVADLEILRQSEKILGQTSLLYVCSQILPLTSITGVSGQVRYQ